MASYTITTKGSSVNYDTYSPSWNSACQIDSNHFINFWNGGNFGNNGLTQVFEINTSTWNVTTSNSNLDYIITGEYNSCANIDSNHFINFCAGSGDDAFAQVIEVNTTTWAVTTASAALEFDTVYGLYNDCCQIDSNHFINFWLGNGGDGYGQVFEVNTTTWAVTTANSSLNIDSGSAFYHSCKKIDDNHVINFWAGTGTDGFVQVFEVNTTTWAVTTANSLLEFDTVLGEHNSCAQIDSNHFINFWAGSGNDGFVQVFEINTSTWAITTAAASLEFDTANVDYSKCVLIDTNRFINFWYNSDRDDSYAQIFEVNTSTWEVVTAGSKLVFDTQGTGFNSCIMIDTAHVLNCFGGASLDGYAQIFEITEQTFTPFWITVD